MIIDCFMFRNELDILEIRLNTLNKYVSKFIIVEAWKTHAGTNRHLVFPEYKERFKNFLDKIEYVKIDFPNQNMSRMQRDNYQRNQITTYITPNNARDWIMIGDVDEIPNLSTWTGEEGVFSGDAYFYKINKWHPERWNGTAIILGWRFYSPFGACTAQDIRNFRDVLRTVGYGQHFSWLGDPYEKVKAFAHEELDTPDFKPNYMIHPGDGRTLQTVPIDEKFPEYIRDNLDKYSHLIEECRYETV